MAKNRVIGKNNTLPWHIKEDLQLFKKNTLDSVIAMWRKTFESIWKPLPKRENIVFSRSWFNFDWVKTYYDYDEFIADYEEKDKVFIIWWSKIYEDFLEKADEIWLSEIKKEYDWDTFFPKFEDKYNEFSRENITPEFDFVVYKKK